MKVSDQIKMKIEEINKRLLEEKKIKTVEEIEFVEKIIPQSSCGTGYSEPTTYRIFYDDGTFDKVIIDSWCVPKKKLRTTFLETIISNNLKIKNLDEAFEMFKTEGIKNGVIKR